MNDWEDIKIIDAFEFTKKSPKMKISKDDILPFIKMEDIPLTRIYADQFISKKYSDISSATYFENGDLLLAKITPSFENGKQGIAHIESTFGFATTEVIPIKAKIGISDIRYLFFYLKNQTVRKELAGKMEGSTGRQRLRKELLENRIISLPSLNEQHKIAYTLSAIQEAIETQEKIIKTTTELKKALMQKLFTEGLYSEKQKQTEIGLVPESWEVKEFDQFTTLKRGKDLTKKDFQNGMIPVAGSHGIIGYHNSSYVDAPGITVGRSGSCGEVVYYNIAFWAHNTALFVSDFHRNNKKFAYYYLKHLNLGRFKTGASVPTLDRNSFKRLPIAIPELSEQKEIAQTLDSINKKIEITTKKQVSLQSLFNSMLHQLMSGKIRVNTL